MALNANNVLDTTELATGKDGKLFVTINGTVYFLAEVDTFSTNMEVQSVDAACWFNSGRSGSYRSNFYFKLFRNGGTG